MVPRSRLAAIKRLGCAACLALLLLAPAGPSPAAQTWDEWDGAKPNVRAPTTIEHDRFEEITDDMCEDGGGTAADEREAEQILLKTYGQRHPANARFLHCSARRYAGALDMRGALRNLQRAKSVIESLPVGQRDGYEEILTDLGQLYSFFGRSEDALATIDLRRKMLGPVDSAGGAFAVGNLLSDRIDMLVLMGRLQEAETDARTRLAMLTEHKQRDIDLVPSERQLAEVLLAQGRYRDAFEIAATAYNTNYSYFRRYGGPFDFGSLLESTLTLAKTMRAVGRWKEAEERLLGVEEARKTYEKNGIRVTGNGEMNIASDLYNLHLLDRRYAEAKAAGERVLEIAQRKDVTEPGRDVTIALARSHLGLAQCFTGDFRAARVNLDAMQLVSGVFGGFLDLPAASPWLTLQAECELRMGNRAGAVALARRAMIANHTLMRGAPRNASVALGGLFEQKVPAGLTLLRAQWPGTASTLSEEQFQAIQQIRPSPAEAATLEAAAATRARAAGLGALVDEYRAAETAVLAADRNLATQLSIVERLAARREAERDKLFRLDSRKTLSGFSAEDRDAHDKAQASLTEAEGFLAQDRRIRDQAAARLALVTERTRSQLRDYLAARQSGGVPLARVTGSLLRPTEALVVITPGAPGQKGFVMVATQGEAPVWAELRFDSVQLEDAIKAVRSGIEAGGRTLPTDARPGTAGPDGFNRQAALELYQVLFANPAIARLLTNRDDWLIVPQGTLLSLPFAALVTEEPPGGVPGNANPDELRRTKWLGASKALSIIPSVSALAALREKRLTARPSRTTSLFAIGEPDLEAWRQGLRSNSVLRELVPLSRQDQIQRLGPIGSTEIGALRERLPAGDGTLVGPDATEQRLRAARGLGSADIVLFATHGLIGDEALDALEPALLLTPPGMIPNGITYAEALKNDGLLTASEAASLHLSAEWVVLSACDTAKGQQRGDGLSGLARAFFTAGARSLLVSQWAVQSTAAKRLSGGAIALWLGGGISKAHALREEMRTMIKDPSGDLQGYSFAHPARWAAFQYVGAE